MTEKLLTLMLKHIINVFINSTKFADCDTALLIKDGYEDRSKSSVTPCISRYLSLQTILK